MHTKTRTYNFWYGFLAGIVLGQFGLVLCSILFFHPTQNTSNTYENSTATTRRSIQPIADTQSVRVLHTRTLAQFLEAIRQVESAGDDRAIGDNGRSKGPYQIGRAYWQDAIEYGTKYDACQSEQYVYDVVVWNRTRCEQVMKWYWMRYCRVAYETKDFETLARVHNGGPNGAKKQVTIVYWDKVRKNLLECEETTQ